MAAINELFDLIFGAPLFRSVERPREWGWVLRASSGAWAEFIHTTDKLLSDNLSERALDAAGAPTLSPSGDRMGTLNRLQTVLAQKFTVKEVDVKRVFSPIRRVRSERQGPAHATTAPVADATIAARQRDLLADLGESLSALRELFECHPKAEGWQVPDELAGKPYRL